ncbi:MAG: FtsX-like permease family protein [Chitinophagaceae bacterium]
MNWSAFIARKIISAPQQSFSKFIIRLSVVATGVSVAAMLVTLCLVNGFQDTVSKKVFSFWGHIHVELYSPSRTIMAEEEGFKDSTGFRALIAATPGVAHVQPFATKSAILKKDETFSGVVLKGFDSSFDWGHFEPFMESGTGIGFTDTSYTREVVLSKKMASDLKVKTNDSLLLYFLRGESNIQYRKVKVAGIFKTGIEEYDQGFALTDIRLLRRMNLWDKEQIGGYEVWVKNLDLLDTINTQIFKQLPDGLNSLTIRKQYPNIFDWLDVQHQTKWIVICIMAVVAIINLITCLLILVLERTTMVGLLQSLGAGNRSIQKIFLMYASYISVAGIALGSILGLGLCWAEDRFHFLPMDEATYYVSYAPVYFNWLQIGIVLAGTALVCFLALIVPSFLVSRITPVKALRFQ